MNDEVLELENEEWKDIPGYENLYQASSLGRIRSHKNKVSYTKRHGARHWKSRIIKGRGTAEGTGKRVNLWKNGTFKEWLVARLVAITFLGFPPKNQNTVNHKNGNRIDNRIENLEWLSLGDNIRHAFETGLMPYRKIKLYNKNCDLLFTSMSKASEFLGRSHGYVRNRISKHSKIKDINNNEYFYEFI